MRRLDYLIHGRLDEQMEQGFHLFSSDDPGDEDTGGGSAADQMRASATPAQMDDQGRPLVRGTTNVIDASRQILPPAPPEPEPVNNPPRGTIRMINANGADLFDISQVPPPQPNNPPSGTIRMINAGGQDLFDISQLPPAPVNPVYGMEYDAMDDAMLAKSDAMMPVYGMEYDAMDDAMLARSAMAAQPQRPINLDLDVGPGFNVPSVTPMGAQQSRYTGMDTDPVGQQYSGLLGNTINALANQDRIVNRLFRNAVNNNAIVDPNFGDDGQLDGFAANTGPFGTMVYTGMNNPNDQGMMDDGNDTVPPVENPMTGTSQCPDGYVFDTDLQACRRMTKRELRADGGTGADSSTAAGDMFYRRTSLDDAPANLPSGFDFDDANRRFTESYAYQPSFFRNPMSLSGFTKL